MKRMVSVLLAVLALSCVLPPDARAEELLIPVGEVIGLELQDSTVVVAALDDVLGGAAREAGLQVGDEIQKVNGAAVESADDIRRALEQCGDEVELLVRRGEKQYRLRIKPTKTEDGLRLGVYLRQGIAGIGTVTYYDPSSGEFGALGHGVSTTRGSLLEMTAGNAYAATVQSVRKGKSGQPGQLRGNVSDAQPVGLLRKNTSRGVFGTTRQGWRGQPLPLADYEEITVGGATVLSDVNGKGTCEYSVEILKIYPENRPDWRNFLLKVTDPALLEQTGGIVQGMGLRYNRDNTGNP